MTYTIKLAKNAKVNGSHYKAGQTVENVEESLLEELKARSLVSSFENVDKTNNDELPEYEKITGAQIKERLTALDVDHEGITEKKDLYGLLVATFEKAGE